MGKIIHGHRGHGSGVRTPTYNTWRAMIYRCTQKSHIAYKNYGGRGIKVCDEWRKFSNFLRDMGERPQNKTLDRIDPNGNYEPSNCRWATPKQQARNKRKKKS